MGIGISFNRSFITVTNVLPGDYIFLPFLLIPPQAPQNSPPDATNFYSFFKRDLNANVNSLDMDLRLHYSIFFLDPFLKLSYGRGISDGLTIRDYFKKGISLGLRIALSSNFYGSFEIFENDFRGSLGRSNYIGERGFRIGLGFGFDFN